MTLPGDVVSQRMTKSQLSGLRGSLRTALVSDALDAQGLRHQCLDAQLVPLKQGDSLVGYAFPVELAAVDHVPEAPYQGLLGALDAIGSAEVFVAGTRGAADVAIWGELVTNACLHAGAMGAVCDGFTRDSAIVRTLDFPVFCRGTIPHDSNGRSEVVAHGAPLQFGEVRVAPGDLVVGDDDGVVVVPARVIQRTVKMALDKGERESLFRQAVRDGMSASRAFAKYGVL